MTATGPTATAATFPAAYGQTPGGITEVLDWADVAEQVAASPNYWLATSAVDGRPHLRPVDGVFVDDALAFGGSPATRWVQHLQRHPFVSVSLPDADQAVILEGDVILVIDPEVAIAQAVAVATAAKYPQHHASDQGPRPFWLLRPARVYAWSLSTFPDRATRFDFARQPVPPPSA